MKICMITDDPTSLGGGPTHIRHVSKILTIKHHLYVDVITPLTMDPKFNFYNIWQRIKYAFWILKFLLTTDYDIYHSHTFSTDAFLPIVKLRGKKSAITVHGRGENLIGGGILNKTGIFKFLSWVILYVWPYDFRFSAGKLKGYVSVGNGVDISEFDKERSKPSPKTFTILCVSRRDPVKGLDILEKAFEEVHQQHPNVRLNLVSGRQRTAKDFKTANLYVLPSLSEGLPVVLLEAMAAKLPIVTTDVGDCRELVERARVGLVVTPGNVAAISDAIVRMLNDKNRARMGEAGYRYVKENFTWDKVAARYYSAYSGSPSFV